LILANGTHAGQGVGVGGVSNSVVDVDHPRLLFSPLPPVDLGHVGAGQNHRDQLYEGEDDADASVDDHHGQDVGFERVLEKSHASVGEDLVSDLIMTQAEDALAAALVGFVAAGVGHGEVLANGCGAVVVEAYQVVVAAAAVQVPLELIPLGGDGVVRAVLVQIFVDTGSRDSGLRDCRSQLKRDEDGSELCEESDGQEDSIDGDEEPFFGSGDGKPEEGDEEGVDAEGDHVGGDNLEVG